MNKDEFIDWHNSLGIEDMVKLQREFLNKKQENKEYSEILEYEYNDAIQYSEMLDIFFDALDLEDDFFSFLMNEAINQKISEAEMIRDSIKEEEI